MELGKLDVLESTRLVNSSDINDQKKSEKQLAQQQPAESMMVDSISKDTPAHDTAEEDSDLPLTHALEALLGGLDVPVAELKAVSVDTGRPLEPPFLTEPTNLLKSTIHLPTHQDSAISSEEFATAHPETEEQPGPASRTAQELDTTAATAPISSVTATNPAHDALATNNVSMELGESISEPLESNEFTKEAQSITAKSKDGETAGGTAQTTQNGSKAMDVDANLSIIQGTEESIADISIVPSKIEDQSLVDSTIQATQNEAEAVDIPMVEEGEHPEWEVDSSPIESSSEDSSSDDSSSDESEGDAAYKLLTPEEQARLLMEGDGSDDDDAGKAKGSAAQLRTKNEVPETVVPKPDVTITEEMPIEQLGAVDQIVDNIILIKAKTSGEYRVLESGSVLCLADRSVVGIVSETIGRVQQPFYSILFTNAAEAKEVSLSLGTVVFYSVQHSTYVFTQALKAIKGSDASNLHDEEVGDEEMEFSDDEAEAEHKRRVKQKRMEKRGGKQQQNGNSNRGGHPLQQQHNATRGLNYDEDEEGPYKTLARPVGYENSIGRSEAPQEGEFTGHDRPRDQNKEFRGRGRGDRGRGRGDRGRARGDRGRGRGGYENRPQSRDGYSLPPRPTQSYGPSPYGQPAAPSFPPFGGVTPTASPPMHQAPFAYPSPQQYNPQQPQIWPQFPPPPQGFPQPAYQQMPNIPGWPNMPPGGAFINPAFFNGNQAGSPKPNQWNAQGQWGKKPDGT